MPTESTAHDVLKHYRAKLTIGEGKGTQTYYVRVLSSSDLTEQNNHGLLASAARRKRLRDPGSIDYAVHIDPLQDLDDEELADLIANYASRSLWREVFAELPDSTLPGAPKQAHGEDDLEDKEIALLSPGESEQKRRENLDRDRQVAHDQRLRDERQRITTLDRDTKIKEAARLIRANLCQVDYNAAALRAQVILSTHRDEACTKRYWELSDENKVPTELMGLLDQTYEKASGGAINLPFSIERC